MFKIFKRTPPTVYTCEICKGEGVERRADWDYCPKGHIYVGKRVEE